VTDWGLIIVDMQNDFLDAGGYYAVRRKLEQRPDWDQMSSEQQQHLLATAAAERSLGWQSASIAPVVDNILAALRSARAAQRPVAHVRAVYDRAFAILPPMLYNDPQRRHFPCRPGTWGAEFVRGIDAAVAAREARERIFDKHTYDAFSNPALSDFLREHEVTQVLVCGTETQTCVLATAQHSALLGFRTFILEDAVWSLNAAIADAALTLFRDAWGGTLRAADLQDL